MGRNFRSFKQVTVGFGSAGFVTGVLLTLALLLPLYPDSGLVIHKDLPNTRNSLTQGKKTEKLKLAKAVTMVISTIFNSSKRTDVITSITSLYASKANITDTKYPKATEKAICKYTMMRGYYFGHVNMTRSGIPCQHWKDDYPHRRLRAYNIQYFPDDSFALAKNYCRNPYTGPLGAWCYTMDPDVRFGYCSVKPC